MQKPLWISMGCTLPETNFPPPLTRGGLSRPQGDACIFKGIFGRKQFNACPLKRDDFKRNKRLSTSIFQGMICWLFKTFLEIPCKLDQNRKNWSSRGVLLSGIKKANWPSAYFSNMFVGSDFPSHSVEYLWSNFTTQVFQISGMVRCSPQSLFMTHSHRSFIRRWQIGDQLEWNASLGGKGTPCKLTVAAGVFVACFFFLAFFQGLFWWLGLILWVDPVSSLVQNFTLI